MTQHAAGMFCWSQLGTKDPEGAKKFYAPLFGWTYEDTTIGGDKFTLLKKGGKTIGGLYGLMKEQIDHGVPPTWEAYVAVESADEVVARVKKHGGRIVMEPFDVLDHGRMAVCQDPTTATFSLWQPKKQIGAEVINEVDTMCWNELITKDAAKADTMSKVWIPAVNNAGRYGRWEYSSMGQVMRDGFAVGDALRDTIAAAGNGQSGRAG